MNATTCPQCQFSGTEDAYRPVVRQGKAVCWGHVQSICDVGFRCPRCQHEFGFAVFVSRAPAERMHVHHLRRDEPSHLGPATCQRGDAPGEDETWSEEWGEVTCPDCLALAPKKIV